MTRQEREIRYAIRMYRRELLADPGRHHKPIVDPPQITTRDVIHLLSIITRLRKRNQALARKGA